MSKKYSSKEFSISCSMRNLDESLELMYGSSEEKIMATKNILKFCTSFMNLENLKENDQMMSALSRMLADDSSSSTQLSFNLGKIFLSFSNFKRFHPILSSFRVGYLLMSILDLELKRIKHREQKQMQDDIVSTKRKAHALNSRHEGVLFVAFKVLENLSDDVSVLRKMVKKGLLNYLLILIEKNSQNCIHVILSLLSRCCIFKECCHEIVFGNFQTIDTLVKNLALSDRDIVKKTLNVIYNLSFDANCRQKMIEAKVGTKLIQHMKKSSTRKISILIIYNITVDNACRDSLLSNQLNHAIIQAVANRQNDSITNELSAVAINVRLHSP